jgi:transcriptional regulator with XRE-family HTH domain
VEAKLTRTHPGYIEQGYRKPTVSTLNRVAKALDLKLEDLFRDL